MKASPLASVVAVLLLASGCGGGSEPPDAPGSALPAEPLSIADARASDLQEPLLVEGAIVAVEGQPVRLCTALLESYPPQCGRPSLEVRGLDLESLELETSAADPSVAAVRWSDRPVRVLGTVEGGVLTVSDTVVAS